MKKYIKENWFRLVLSILIFTVHSIAYWIIPAIFRVTYIDMPEWMITVFDEVPFVPFFMVFYFGCFAWWVISFLTATKERVYPITIVAVIGYAIIEIFFFAFPVAMHREELVLEGNDIFSNLVRFLWVIDEPGKLFPSVHVFVSTLAYLVVAFDKNKKIWWRIVCFIMMMMVWISTLFLKQHYFIDGLVAVILALILWFIVEKTKMTNSLYKLENYFDKKIEDKKEKTA